jgi:hypothetical protein
MRAIDTLLCATTHYGLRESDALHDTGELPDALHDTGELASSLHDTGELPGALHDSVELTRARQDTGEVPTALANNKTFSLPQTHYCECRLCLLGFPLLLPYG